jgi:hypothetical protein
MSRVFTEKITKKELAGKIWEKIKDRDDDSGYDYDWRDQVDSVDPIDLTVHYRAVEWMMEIPQIKKDMSKVRFDLENTMVEDPYPDFMKRMTGYHTLDNGLTFLGMICGGDWETPVFSIVYWDGQKLRSYVPTDGNLFNRKLKMAYGNSDEEFFDGGKADAEDVLSLYFADVENHPSIDELMDQDFAYWDEIAFNVDKLKADIIGRIIFKGEESEGSGDPLFNESMFANLLDKEIYNLDRNLGEPLYVLDDITTILADPDFKSRAEQFDSDLIRTKLVNFLRLCLKHTFHSTSDMGDEQLDRCFNALDDWMKYLTSDEVKDAIDVGYGTSVDEMNECFDDGDIDDGNEIKSLLDKKDQFLNKHGVEMKR